MKLGDAAPGDLLISDVPYSDMRAVDWALYVGRFEVTAADIEAGAISLDKPSVPEWLKAYRGGLGGQPGLMSFTRGDGYRLPSTKPGTYFFTIEASGPIQLAPSSSHLKLWDSGRYLSPVDPEGEIRRAEHRHAMRLERSGENFAGVRYVVHDEVEVSVVGSRRDTSIRSYGDGGLRYNEHFEIVSQVDWLCELRGVETGETVYAEVRHLAADAHDFELNRHRVKLVEATTQAPREALRSALGRLDDTVDPRAIRVTGETVTMPWATVKALLTNPEAGEAVQALMESALFVEDAASETGVGPRLVLD